MGTAFSSWRGEPSIFRVEPGFAGPARSVRQGQYVSQFKSGGHLTLRTVTVFGVCGGRVSEGVTCTMYNVQRCI